MSDLDSFRGEAREWLAAHFPASLRGKTLSLYPDLLNRKGIEGHMADMLEGRRPVDFSLWRIISLGIWGRVFSVAM